MGVVVGVCGGPSRLAAEIIYLTPYRPDMDSSRESADLCGEAGAPADDKVTDFARAIYDALREVDPETLPADFDLFRTRSG